MSCQAIDIKAYSFGEVTAAERREAEAHLKSCEDCRAELAQLQLVQAALGALHEEEPPRRIAFVSDKVFEPSWWQRFWASGPQVGFAASGLLAAAILAHAFTRPATVVNNPAPVVQQQQFDEQAMQKRIEDAVIKAVAQIDQRQESKVDQLLAATEKKYELETRAMAISQNENELLRKQNQNLLIRTAGLVKD